MRHRDEVGETLVEVVLTIVLIGLTVGALLVALGTAASASKAQRDRVTADTVLRSYAEATKNAVRSCTGATGTYSVVFTPPAGFNATGAGTACPAPTAPQNRTLVVTDADGTTTTMTIVVRTP